MLISLGNIIPSPADLGEAVCVFCRRSMVLNHRGNFLAGSPQQFCCDDCGGRLRPDLRIVLHRLRHCVNVAPTIGGSESRVCPDCGELVEADAIIGWHIVDVRNGQPICDDCLFDVDPAIVGLTHVLQALSRAEALARMEIR